LIDWLKADDFFSNVTLSGQGALPETVSLLSSDTREASRQVNLLTALFRLQWTWFQVLFQAQNGSDDANIHCGGHYSPSSTEHGDRESKPKTVFSTQSQFCYRLMCLYSRSAHYQTLRRNGEASESVLTCFSLQYPLICCTFFFFLMCCFYFLPLNINKMSLFLTSVSRVAYWTALFTTKTMDKKKSIIAIKIKKLIV